MARDVLGWSEEELNTVKNGSPNGQNEFVEWVMDTMARNMNTELAKAAGATNGGVKKDDKLMQKISGPTRINMRDFTAILLFQERHPDIFTDTTVNDVVAQMDTFNRLFEGPYADEFKTLLHGLII